RCAGKGHHGDRVPGEALTAQDHVPAHHACHHGHDRTRLQRVDHELIGEQFVHVVHQIPGERGVCHQSCLWPCTCGASGWPTTTSRPSRARSTSISTP